MEKHRKELAKPPRERELPCHENKFLQIFQECENLYNKRFQEMWPISSQPRERRLYKMCEKDFRKTKWSGY